MSLNRRISKTFLQKKRTNSINSKEILDNINSNKVKTIKTGPWDDKEDLLLKEWVNKHGAKNWTECANYMGNRTGKQCREHWNNSLDESLKKGNWTAEEDLLIMKFYKKYESWRKMIPMFKQRTENSIKNRFFSQLRKILIKRQQTGKREYGTKFGLETLKNYLDEGIKEAEKRYYEENKNMTKEGFENYMKQIENLMRRKRSGKFIDLDSIKENNNYDNYSKTKSKIINIDEDEEKENDENLETINMKKKRIKNKAKRFVISKANKNNEELNTREETINSENSLKKFQRQKSSKLVKNSSKSLNIIQENNEIENDFKDNNDSIININNNKSKEIFNNKNTKLEENNISNIKEIPYKQYNFNTYKINEGKPELMKKESKIYEDNITNNVKDNEDDLAKQTKAFKFYTNDNVTSRELQNFLKGRNINLSSLGNGRSIDKNLLNSLKFKFN